MLQRHRNHIKLKYQSHPTAVIHTSAEIGEGTKIWHFSHIMNDCQIGAQCSIGQNVVVSPNVKLGKQVKIQNNVSVYEGVQCEDYVFLGPSMVFTNVINPRSEINRRNEFKKTIIKKGASIGANATIVCGVQIGEYAFVGAGAIVTKNIPPHALVMGNPAIQTAWMSRAGSKLSFDCQGIATCSLTSEKYILNNEQQIKILE